MGTNFYYKDGTHIGKRSGAGSYCYKCGQTLCILGEEGVHSSEPHQWYDECPVCGVEYMANACSFRWAIKPDKLKETTIKDEYGQEYTFEQFEDILVECPIIYYDSIGREFS